MADKGTGWIKDQVELFVLSSRNSSQRRSWKRLVNGVEGLGDMQTGNSGEAGLRTKWESWR